MRLGDSRISGSQRLDQRQLQPSFEQANATCTPLHQIIQVLDEIWTAFNRHLELERLHYSREGL